MKKHKILIIDDSLSICNTLKSLIESDIDINILIAKSLKEAAQIILKEKVKVKLLENMGYVKALYLK